MTKQAKVKACPRCGWEVRIEEWVEGGGGWWFHCTNTAPHCGFSELILVKTKATAVRRWNRRVRKEEGQ